MSELKTKPTNQSVVEFLNTIEPEEKRKDSFALVKLFQNVSSGFLMWIKQYLPHLLKHRFTFLEHE